VILFCYLLRANFLLFFRNLYQSQRLLSIDINELAAHQAVAPLNRGGGGGGGWDIGAKEDDHNSVLDWDPHVVDQHPFQYDSSFFFPTVAIIGVVLVLCFFGARFWRCCQSKPRRTKSRPTRLRTSRGQLGGVGGLKSLKEPGV